MAEVTGKTGAGHRKHRGHRASMPAPRIDMTPMVDLGFLLITFFMLSMKMGQPNAMEWDKRISEVPPEPVSECCVLNILIDSADRVYTYEGEDIKALQPTSFNQDMGIEQVIMIKAKKVKLDCGVTKNGQPHKLICLIKLLPGSRYQNLTDAMDEMNITKTQYSIQEPLPEEVTALKEKEQLAENNTRTP
jgi:biopolymer transport protein ExbD